MTTMTIPDKNVLESVVKVMVLMVGASLNMMVIKLEGQVPPMVKRTLNDFVVLVQCWLSFSAAICHTPIELSVLYLCVHHHPVTLSMDLSIDLQTSENMELDHNDNGKSTEMFEDYQTIEEKPRSLNEDIDIQNVLQLSVFREIVYWSRYYHAVFFLQRWHCVYKYHPSSACYTYMPPYG